MVAKESGEAAEHRTEVVSPGADEIKTPGFVPSVIADGQLLETHAKLGELTRNIYTVLLLVEGGLFFFSEPFFERWRGRRRLAAGLERGIRALWMVAAVAGIVVVVLTGHYGGQLVYSHSVGTLHDTPSSSHIQAP